MTADENRDQAIAVIEMCRRIYRSASLKLAAKGVEPIDLAISGVYFVHDTAVAAGHNAQGAIEWMRATLDDMERQLLERVPGSRTQ